MKIVDAQIHVWAEETPERPWIPGGQAMAHLPEPLMPKDVLREMDRVGVDRCILVPPTWEGERNDLAIAASEQYPDRFAVIARVPLDSDAQEGSARLREAFEHPAVLGARTVFIRDTAEYFADGTADWFFSTAAEANMPLLVYAPGQQYRVAEKAEEYPELKMTICHLGIDVNLRDEEIVKPIDDVIELARYPNVAVKVSSLPSFVTDPYPFKSLHPHIQRVVEAFGPERSFWGSDLSRLRCDYAELKSMFLEELDFLSDDDLELIMGRAICDWFDWPLPRD